jgi:predicted transcriptional regulator
VRTIIDLPDEQIEPLKELAARTGLSRAELVRRAIAEYLRREAVATGDAAFGLWRKRSEDGLAYQKRLRTEWDE